MARTKRSNNILSASFCKAVRTAINDMLERGDYETCVTAAEVAAHKAVAKGFTVKNHKRIRVHVMTAVSEGQVSGFSIRKGYNGGIHRVEVKKPRAKKPVQTKTTAVADNDTSVNADNDTSANEAVATGT